MTEGKYQHFIDAQNKTAEALITVIKNLYLQVHQSIMVPKNNTNLRYITTIHRMIGNKI